MLRSLVGSEMCIRDSVCIIGALYIHKGLRCAIFSYGQSWVTSVSSPYPSFFHTAKIAVQASSSHFLPTLVSFSRRCGGSHLRSSIHHIGFSFFLSFFLPPIIRTSWRARSPPLPPDPPSQGHSPHSARAQPTTFGFLFYSNNQHTSASLQILVF